VSYKRHFQRFIAADPERLHFAAHSHHFWPDVTFAAQEQCWLDAARLADRKWETVFAEIVPAAQRHVARVLNLPDPATIAFGPNTHGFVMRLLSVFPAGKPIRVLTTDGEFHSFRRQIRRLEEDSLAEVTRIAVEPIATLAERLTAAAARGGHDLVFVSHVFFNSGYVLPDLGTIVRAVPQRDTLIVIDGYHGFLALPTDFGPISGRAFYMAGGYKYAMSGEGACFLHVPPGQAPRPRDTGWFASFGTLETGDDGAVPYAAGGARFLGATFDPVGLYRFRAVMDWLAGLAVTVDAIHAHVHALQRAFVDRLSARKLAALDPRQLVVPIEQPDRGHFLTFRTADAEALHRRLLDAGIVTDYRGDRLRFGFGLYHDPEDIDRLCERLAAVLA
jgi:selenocysteine lyase/cysteine desulfurase